LAKRNDIDNKVTGPLCNFCGESPNAAVGKMLIKGLGVVHICTECVDACKALSLEYTPKDIKNIKGMLKSGFKPSYVVKHLNDYIVGQEKAKMVLAVAIYNHYKMLDYKENNPNSEVEIEKSNILLLGPTGSGKTFILQCLAKFLNVPFAIQDCTNLTAAGYVGEDVENCIRKLVENADGDIKKAEKGIVYLDEFDKLSRKGENMSITRDVSGEAVQQALLKMIEGTIVEVPPKGGRKHPTGDVMKVDTTNILFVCGGSFEGIEKIIEKRLNSKDSGIGFGSNPKVKNTQDLNELFMNTTVEDLKKFGLLPEVLGRLPIVCPLEELDLTALLKILTEPKNALVKQYQELFKMDDMQLEFEEEALLSIAEQAIKRKTGARSLRAIMEESLLKHMYDLPEQENVSKVIITKDCIENGNSPKIEKCEAV
jgi:ATP-dependent Clp protease ATP-binding subunit ClpX